MLVFKMHRIGGTIKKEMRLKKECGPSCFGAFGCSGDFELKMFRASLACFKVGIL